jgi:hypothetical protein
MRTWTLPEPADPPLDDDPFEAALRREPRTGAGVEVLVFDAGDPRRAESIGLGLSGLCKGRGRAARFRVLPSRTDDGLGATLERAAAEAEHPLLIVTSAVANWTPAHLDPLLAAIDQSDHAVGRRPATGLATIRRRLAALVNSSLYAIPVLDVHSPCRIHRREALAAIPLQSESTYVDVELLAKATFLAQLVQEVDVPDLDTDRDPALRALWRHDRHDLLRRPVFRRRPASGPAEEPQRQQEGDDRPGGQHEERGPDLPQPVAEQDHPA